MNRAVNNDAPLGVWPKCDNCGHEYTEHQDERYPLLVCFGNGDEEEDECDCSGYIPYEPDPREDAERRAEMRGERI